MRPRRYEEFSNEVDEALRAATDISEAEYDKIFSGPSSTALESDDFLDYAATSTPHRHSSSSSSSAADGVPSSSWEDAAAELELASSRRRQDKLTAALQKQVCICFFSHETHEIMSRMRMKMAHILFSLRVYFAPVSSAV